MKAVINPKSPESLDHALMRVEQAADPTWLRSAITAVRATAVRKATLTTDDVWETLRSTYPGVDTHEYRALGAVMRIASRHGWIRPSGTYRPTTRPEAHKRPIAVWFSLIHDRD